MIPFRAVIVADPGELAGLRRLFKGWLERAGLPARDVGELVIAVNEAVANAVEHGTPSGFVSVRTKLEQDSLSIRVADSGRWKEPRLLPDTEGRGRGLTIMRALVEDVAIQSSDRGTTVTMRRRLQPAG
jgi:anti-sigma regulatory factor (Ser/Thr protein kinase)